MGCAEQSLVDSGALFLQEKFQGEKRHRVLIHQRVGGLTEYLRYPWVFNGSKLERDNTWSDIHTIHETYSLALNLSQTQTGTHGTLNTQRELWDTLLCYGNMEERNRFKLECNLIKSKEVEKKDRGIREVVNGIGGTKAKEEVRERKGG